MYIPVYHEELLTSQQLYRSEVLSYVPVVSEAELIHNARNGDVCARDRIIHECLSYVMQIAKWLTPYLKHDDYADLVGVGNVALVEHIQHALMKSNPYGYLKRCAKYTMLAYCFSHGRRTYSFEEREKYMISPEVVPQPLEEQFAWLYTAINHLPPLQKDAVCRHFGLCGIGKESLHTSGKTHVTHRPSSLGYNRLYRGLANLRKELEVQ